VHAYARGCELGDPVAVRNPESDVVEGLRRHGRSIATAYFLRSTARWSCCLFIFERPGMFIRLASL
jgi:hypothetical protein